MKKRIIIVSIVIVIGVAVFLITSLRKQRDDGTMLLSGNIEITETNVGFKIPGRVVERLVDEGNQVKPGDIIARLDSAELSAVVAQNRAALKESATRLAELKAGSRPQEIGQARANVRAQEADLEKVRKDFERAEVLYKNGAISATQFDASKSAYESRSAQLRNAGETLSLVKEGPRKEDIQIAAHRVEQASAAVAASEERLKDTAIYSPTDGIVLRKNVEPGETIAAGTPIVTIGDLAQPWVKVYVKEDKMGLVKLGQKATITVDTYKGKTYDGTVSYISSEAEFTPKTVQTPEERVKLVFGVKVKVKNEKGELKPSMPADVRLVIKP
ncbi:MAG: ABC transporter substrate-binding protein [Syntrophus sp. (in: bacteria)]|nr:ABC transporter substrate-binding protein [Syntrophus sp. (in: bacteria)]